VAISVFDLFKIGIGPSSSHTVGPMRAARMFTSALEKRGLLASIRRVVVQLHGSLGATGKGHGSDKAVLLGLSGHDPETVDVDQVPAWLHAIRDERRLMLAGKHPIAYEEKRDLLFFRRPMPLHANGMQFAALGADDTPLYEAAYYSVGGGFVVSDVLAADGSRHKIIAPDTTVLPHPFHSGADLLQLTEAHGISIAELMRRNERHWRDDAHIDAGLLAIWRTMQACIERGCRTEGELPGGFRVRRRAATLARSYNWVWLMSTAWGWTPMPSKPSNGFAAPHSKASRRRSFIWRRLTPRVWV